MQSEREDIIPAGANEEISPICISKMDETQIVKKKQAVYKQCIEEQQLIEWIQEDLDFAYSELADNCSIADYNKYDPQRGAVSSLKLSFWGRQPKSIGYGRHGTYTGQGITEQNEIVYFKMELITYENMRHWERYRGHVRNMLEDNYEDSFLSLIHLMSKQENNAADIAKKEQYSSIIQLLETNGFTDDRASKTSRLKQIILGCQYTAINLDNYIVYATKDPEFDIRKCSLSDEYGADEFIRNYGNLLMVVSTNLQPLFERRHIEEKCFCQVGIFRDPWSLIKGDYKNIAYLLHSFTAAAVFMIDDSFGEMYIPLPTSPMIHILKEELSKKNASNAMREVGSAFMIKSSVLRNSYYADAQVSRDYQKEHPSEFPGSSISARPK